MRVNNYKHGYEKNTKPIKEIDPKTGKEGTTIPDAFKNEGKSTSEVKNVKQQSYTKQLRLQEKLSADNGFKPELIINEGAKLSKPLQNSSFDIIKYSVVPPAVQDKTRVSILISVQVLQIQQKTQTIIIRNEYERTLFRKRVSCHRCHLKTS